MIAITDRDREVLSYFSQVIVSYSAGVDSTWCLLWALETGKPIRAIMADTGNEPPDTPEYLHYIERATGVKAEVEKRDGYSFDEMVRRRGMWPMHGKCMVSRAVKIDNFKWYLEATGTPPDALIILGQRRDESRKRSELPDFSPIVRSGRSAYRPALDFDKQAMFQGLADYGIMAHPAYGRGRARVGCVWCVNHKLCDLIRDEKMYPARCAELRALRTSIGLSSLPAGVQQDEMFPLEVCKFESVHCE